MEETLKSIWYKNSPSPDLSLPCCFFFHDIQFTVWLIMTFFPPPEFPCFVTMSIVPSYSLWKSLSQLWFYCNFQSIQEITRSSALRKGANQPASEFWHHFTQRFLVLHHKSQLEPFSHYRIKSSFLLSLKEVILCAPSLAFSTWSA